MTDDSALVDAQRRTTHAVRAIAFFVLILFPSSFVGTILLIWGLNTQAQCGGYCASYEPDGTPQFIFGGLLLLGGIVVAVIQGWSELSKS